MCHEPYGPVMLQISRASYQAPTQLELPLSRPVEMRLVAINSEASAAPLEVSNVVELKISSIQRLMNSMPGMSGVLKRAEGLDW